MHAAQALGLSITCSTSLFNHLWLTLTFVNKLPALLLQGVFDRLGRYVSQSSFISCLSSLKAQFEGSDCCAAAAKLCESTGKKSLMKSTTADLKPRKFIILVQGVKRPNLIFSSFIFKKMSERRPALSHFPVREGLIHRDKH